MRYNRGFSLIELLVVVTVSSMLMAGGLIAYSNIQSSQRIRAGEKVLRSMLYKARQEALLGLVNRDGCSGSFDGKTFKVSSDGTELFIYSTCNGSLASSADTSVSLDPGVTVEPYSSSVLFNSIRMGASNAIGFVVQYGDEDPVTIAVDVNGGIQ